MSTRMILFLLFIIVDAVGGVFYAREAFTEAMTNVISSEASNTPLTSSPIPTFDTSSCMTGVLDDKPMNVNRCHSEQMWAREQQTPTPYVEHAPPTPTMTKDESSHTAVLFGVAMLAGLFALGAIGAGTMWFLRE